MPVCKTHSAGFSLLQISILLTVGAIIVASQLPGGEGGSDAEKIRVTLERMRTIEIAMQNFMTANQRRPYPSDLTAATSASAYGTEITPPTDYGTTPTTHFTETVSPATTTCTAGSATMTITSSSIINNGWLVSAASGIPSSTAALTQVISRNDTAPTLTNVATTTCAGADFRNPLVAGGVPTKSLGLPDSYGIDGFGRRIVYMVDQRATVAARCMDLQGRGLSGALQISSSTTPTSFANNVYDNTMWALLSYGKDGQGGMSAQGSGSLDTRIQTGNIDADTLVNAFYNSSQARSYSDERGLIAKEHTTTFDDIVWYDNASKNTCCMGECNSHQDFRIDGGGSGATSSVTFGDVNGDSFPDLIVGNSSANQVKVIFGRKDGWPVPANAFTTALDGTNGFTIARGTVSAGFGGNVLSGDVNGDGYADILIGSSGASPNYAIVFGGRAWPATYTIGTTTSPTSAITIAGLNTQLNYAAIGDVNGDGYDDVVLPYEATSQKMAVIYGASSLSNFTVSDANLNETAGIYFVGTTRDSFLAYGESGIAEAVNPRFAICDVNGDSFADLVIPGLDYTAITTENANERLFVYTGRSTANFASAASSGAINSSTAVKLTFNTDGTDSDPVRSVYCKDINSDGFDDIIVNKTASSNEYIYVKYGAASFTTDKDMSSASDYDIRFDLTASAPAWQDSAATAILTFGDMNNDGKNDIIMSRKTDNPCITAAGVISGGGCSARSNAGFAYILYQPGAGWGVSPGLAKNWHAYNYDGSEGTRITGAVASDSVAVQATNDMNKDGKTDLILASDVSPGGGYFMFGKSSWTNATSYDLNCLRDTVGSHCAAQINAQ